MIRRDRRHRTIKEAGRPHGRPAFFLSESDSISRISDSICASESTPALAGKPASPLTAPLATFALGDTMDSRKYAASAMTVAPPSMMTRLELNSPFQLGPVLPSVDPSSEWHAAQP